MKTFGESIKHYTFEFMVVFVAVFLGFWADSYRESRADREKEREYVVSLLKDLRGDSAILSKVIATNEEHLSQISAFNEIQKLDLDQRDNVTRFYKALVNSSIWKANLFAPNEVTIAQLKNTGDIRLFEKPFVADSLTQYILAIEDMRQLSARYYARADGAIRIGFEVCDYFAFGKLYFADPKNSPTAFTITHDRDKLRLLFNLTNDLYYTVHGYNDKSTKLLNSIRSLIVFLEAKYDVKK